jgi:taurine transport system permease protein
MTTAAQPKTSSYATLGEGSSTAISIVTMVGLFALWWIASHFRWLPPLFLPTPETVFTRLYESAMGQLTDAPLATHFGWSMFRVFSAFLAACVTAIPIWHRDGRVTDRPRYFRSADRVLSAAAAARVSAVDRDLVRDR